MSQKLITKETYIRPEMELITISFENRILEGSDGNGTGSDWGLGGED